MGERMECEKQTAILIDGKLGSNPRTCRKLPQSVIESLQSTELIRIFQMQTYRVADSATTCLGLGTPASKTAVAQPFRIAFALVAMLSIVCSTSCGQENSRSYPPSLPAAREQVYKKIGDVELKLYIYEPKQDQAKENANANRAAIVFFFGGGWTSGTPEQFQHQAEHLAKRGMVAILADYRVKSRHQVKAVSCVEDAKSAIRWVREHAKDLRVDPNRIVASGGSAGGHIAACTLLLDEFDESTEDAKVSSKPNALVLFNPGLITAPVKEAPEVEAQLRKQNVATIAERLGVEPERLSPYHHLRKDLPPCIIFHGKADTTVPYLTVEAFTKRMTELGSSCELVGYEGAQHGFFNYSRKDKKAYEDTLAKTDAFLTKLGYIEAKR